MLKDSESQVRPEGGSALKDYEDVIRRIREVMAVRVVAAADGEIAEIHVLAGNGRGPKQIVRDIESSLMAQFGVPVDHKKISVAQVEEGSTGMWGTGRLRLVGIRFTIDSARAEAEVKVEFDDVVRTGQATGPASATNRLRVVAEAALAAVAEYFNSRHQLALEDVAVLPLRGCNAVITMMSMLAPSGEELLVGACLIRHGEVDAVARSVLDALNRRFTMVVRKPAASNGGSKLPGDAGES